MIDIGDGISRVEVQVLLPVDSKNRQFSMFILNLRLILHRFQCSLEILERYLGSMRVNAPRAPPRNDRKILSEVNVVFDSDGISSTLCRLT